MIITTSEDYNINAHNSSEYYISLLLQYVGFVLNYYNNFLI